MNIKDMKTIARQMQAEETTVKTKLSDETMALIQRANNHHGASPYLDLPDGITMFKVTYVTYAGNRFIAQGIVWPYRQPAKAANFLFMSYGTFAKQNVSDIMERCDGGFKNEREAYRIKKVLNPELKYPYWTKPIDDVLVDAEFIVKASHYNGHLQLDFSTWRFQKELKQAELNFQLNATDPELRERRKKERERKEVK